MIPDRSVRYDRDAVLKPEQVAKALCISIRKLSDLPIRAAYLGRRCKRYQWKDVQDYLDGVTE